MTGAARRDPTRDRLLTSLLLAVLLHALAFVALEIFLKLSPQREAEYRGPLFVQLEELPVVRQARQPAPAALAAASASGAAAPAAAAGQAGAVARSADTPPPLPSGPPLRAAAGQTAPASGQGPTGSPFRMEGSPAQQGPPRPAGQGFQVPSTEPTLPPAGTQSQGPPLRAVAPGEGASARAGGQAPAVPLQDLDRALASGSAARAGAGAGAAAPGAAAGAQSGAGRADSSQEGFSIVLPDSVRGREVLSMPRINIPKWVSESGLRLSGDVSFELTPQGVLLDVKTVKSSGYSDVDTVVLDAVRRMKFQPGARDSPNVRGTVTYLIVPTDTVR